MRCLLAALLILPVLAYAADKKSEVYKWVDEKGVVHYTDKPPAEGAKPAKLPPLQTYKGGTNPNLGKFQKKGAEDAGPAAQIQVVTPARDETFRSGERVVPVAVLVTPQLTPEQRLIYLLDGRPASPPTTDTSYALTNVDRGTHTVSVTLINAAGEELASSTGITVHMKPPTEQAGQAGAPPKPAPTTPPKPKPKPP